MFEGCKVYGPYTAKDGRQRVFLVYPNGRKRTVSYPKYLMEIKLGRELDPKKETIDHIDGNFLNNDFKNLRILPIEQHVSEDTVQYKSLKCICLWCKNTFTRIGKQVSTDARNRRRNIVGPFCSRRCSGKYGVAVQKQIIKPFNVVLVSVKPEKPIKSI